MQGWALRQRFSSNHTPLPHPRRTSACSRRATNRARLMRERSAARRAYNVPRSERRYPMADVTPDLIFQVANGFMAAKHLFVANEIGLFEALGDAPATLDDLAHRTGIPR